MTICTYNARSLATESSIEDLLTQAKMIRYDVIGLTETRRRHPFNAVYESGEELFLGTCDNRGVGGVGVLVLVGHKHRFVRTTNNPNRTLKVEEMWINTGFNNLRRLRTYIELRRGRVRNVLYEHWTQPDELRRLQCTKFSCKF